MSHAIAFRPRFPGALRALSTAFALALGLATAGLSPAGAQAPAAAPSTTPAPAAPQTGKGEPQGIPSPDQAQSAETGALPVELAAKPVAVMSGSADWDNGYKDLQAAFAKIRTELGKAGIEPAGRPLAVFLQTDDQGFRYDAMIPIAAAPAGKDQLSPDVKLSTSPAGKTLKFEHRGAYDDIDSTYEAITAYLDEKGLEAKNLFVEQYLNDATDADDTNLAVDVYVFIK